MRTVGLAVGANATECQCEPSGRQQVVGDNERDQAGDPSENGFLPMSRQDLLRQVSTTRGPGSDTRADFGSAGTYNKYIFQSMVRLTPS